MCTFNPEWFRQRELITFNYCDFKTKDLAIQVTVACFGTHAEYIFKYQSSYLYKSSHSFFMLTVEIGSNSPILDQTRSF